MITKIIILVFIGFNTGLFTWLTFDCLKDYAKVQYTTKEKIAVAAFFLITAIGWFCSIEQFKLLLL